MTIHHFLCDDRYVRLLFRPGWGPVAYHPDTREMTDPAKIKPRDRLLNPPPGPLGPRPVTSGCQKLVQCWLPEEEWSRWWQAEGFPAGTPAVIKRVEREIHEMERRADFPRLLINPKLKADDLPDCGGDEILEQSDRQSPSLDLRPATYWNGGGIVKGEYGSQRMAAAIPQGAVGEWLPDLDDGEVEIVMIGMRSTMGDVISVRARKDGDTICYRVVDEYGDEDGTDYDCAPRESALPLTVGEIRKLLWSIGVSGYGHVFAQAWKEQLSGDIREYKNDFFSIKSDFYDGLQSWLDGRFEKWKHQRV